MKLSSLIVGACTLAACTVSTLYGSHAIADATLQRYEPALRDLWERGSERFHRQWLIAGPIDASDATHLDASELKPIAGKSLSETPTSPHWVPYTAWTDITELSTIEGRTVTTAEPIDRYVFVAGVLQRGNDTHEDLMIGSERPYAVWLNGKEIHARANAEGFLPDRDRVPVLLQAGENSVLLRIHETSIGPTQFSLRTVPRGTPVTDQDELAPIVLRTAPGELAIQTHFTKKDASQVEVVVQGAGARSMASRRAARGDVVRFDTTAWPTGAYEIRISSAAAGPRSTSTSTSTSTSKILPWYHGNAIDAVRTLVRTAASAPEDVDGDTLRMLAEMAQDRLGGSIEGASSAAWRLVHSPLMEFEELTLERRGKRGAVRSHGFVRLAYTDEVDGSTQFCRAYLPQDYTPKKIWPLITVLHGHNPPNPEYVDWWTVDERQNPIANQRATIVIEPHGRGNAQYIGIGERDVLRCIEEAKRRFSIDPDRVYLTGESMGGHGTWYIASRHPDLFAAAAPVYGGWDFRVTSISGPPTASEPRSALDAFSYERSSSFANAENLLHVPLLVLHGDADNVVRVENSRHAVQMLQRWGYNVRYSEMPGWAHEDLGQRLAVADWLLTHKRVTAPSTLRLRSTDLAGASAYWFNVRAFERPGEIIRVAAEVLQPGVLRVDSANVASFAVDLPPQLRGDKDQLQVYWNGAIHETLRRGGQDIVELHANSSQRTKQAGLEGPLPAVLATPFIVVVGTTSPDPRMREIIQSRADSLARQWRDWQKQPLRMVRDTELSAEDEKKFSLMLLGDAQSNAITHRHSKALPFEISETSITLAGRKWPVKDAVLQLIHPSPVASDKYVYVIAPTSTDGMYFSIPQLVNFRGGFPVTVFDWIIQDGRRAPAGTMNPADTFVAAGLFDAQWRYQETSTIERDQRSASQWTLRRAPSKDFSPTDASLRALVGDYELFPGFSLTFRVEDGRLTVDVPGSPPIRLTPESEFIHVDAATGNLAEFNRDASGNISGVSVDNNGGVSFAKRLGTRPDTE